MKNPFTLCFLLLPLWGFAQSNGAFSFQYDQSPTIVVNGKSLQNPWAGGLNAVQYSTLRLNDDTRDDLVVFDRTTNKISTFVAASNPAGSGTAWQYAPEYEALFPAVNSWMLLIDYDGDGRNDLFTYGAGTVRVFRNELQNGQVSFRVVADPLITEGFGSRLPLYVSSQDIPAITDYDDDGDVDIIAFGADGNLIAYQQNLSVERTGKPGGLDFKRSNSLCWGHFTKEYCNDFRFGIQCDVAPGRIGSEPGPANSGANPGRARPLHSGNTLLAFDTDGDGHKDLLFGFVSCENIARLRNTGPNNDQANFTSFDSLYPARNPILFPAFPATYREDVDGDGVKDLLASPNVSANDNYAFDFRASSWFYKNVGTNQKPDFQLVQKDFLQSEMLDLGERAAPALADLDGDGDLDLLVGIGYTGPRGKNYRAGIWQFENRGTPQKAAFVPITTDYLGLAQTLTLGDVVPSFADVDANGSTDLILTGTGTQGVEIRVLFNAAAKGSPVRYDLAGAVRWPTPDLMLPGDLLTTTDVDRDGKPDLLISKTSSTIQYFRNAGTATNPIFQLQNQTFGGFTTDDYFYARARSLVVADLNGDRKNEIITAASNGQVRVYAFPERADQPLTLLDSLPALGLPGTGLIATAADLDGDGLPDLMLGSQAGGLRYLKNTSPKIVITDVPQEPTGPWAFPNPTDRYLTIRAPRDGQFDVVSLAGRTVLSAQVVRANVETVIDLSSLPYGTYLVRLQTDNRPAWVQKIIVQR